MNESIVTKTTITLPVNGGALEAVSTIETVPYWTRSRKSGNIFLKYLYIYLKALQQNICTCVFILSAAQTWTDTTTTDQSETASEAPSTPVSEPLHLRTPGGGKKHHFIPKTVRLGSRFNLCNRFYSSATRIMYWMWCFLWLGDQVGVMCGLWEENKVWKDVSSLPGLSGGDPPRVPWPLPHAL